MHIYAFGSVCRGEVDRESDIDCLAIVDNFDGRFNPAVYSIYSYGRIGEIWDEGNPFAWHLARESRLIFASDGTDVIAKMGTPAPYLACEADCRKFLALFEDAALGLAERPQSAVFELSTIFLAIRNIATCFSLGRCDIPVFGRNAAQQIGARSLKLDRGSYSTLVAARVLSTRGTGEQLTATKVALVSDSLDHIRSWMNELLEEASQ